MTDPKTIATDALAVHETAIDDLHKKLASMPGCDLKRLATAVENLKDAHKAFADDALGCVGF